jgi:hypothetical protein
VVIDPSLPCDIAFSIGTTSRPRTSSTITRSGDIRVDFSGAAAIAERTGVDCVAAAGQDAHGRRRQCAPRPRQAGAGFAHARMLAGQAGTVVESERRTASSGAASMHPT